MYNRLIYFIVITIILQSCTGFSNSGRAKIVAQAKKEASKNKTNPEPNTLVKEVVPKVIKIEDVVTPTEERIIIKELTKNKIPPAIGDLIQVEGLVLKEVSELNIKLKTPSNQIIQILTMQEYLEANWHYIFDPISGRDTWRSAEATLSLKYQGQYSGDCDDFAILLASMSRQIGLKARMVGGYNQGEGHAFAEFLFEDKDIPLTKLKELVDFREDHIGTWISLDWFKGAEHDRFIHDIRVYNDI